MRFPINFFAISEIFFPPASVFRFKLRWQPSQMTCTLVVCGKSKPTQRSAPSQRPAISRLSIIHTRMSPFECHNAKVRCCSPHCRRPESISGIPLATQVSPGSRPVSDGFLSMFCRRFSHTCSGSFFVSTTAIRSKYYHRHPESRSECMRTRTSNACVACVCPSRTMPSHSCVGAVDTIP